MGSTVRLTGPELSRIPTCTYQVLSGKKVPVARLFVSAPGGMKAVTADSWVFKLVL